MAKTLQPLLVKYGVQDRKTGKWRPSSAIPVILAILCACVPLSINQLTLAILLAVVYALYQEYQSSYLNFFKASGSREPEVKRGHSAPNVTPQPAAVTEHRGHRHSAPSQRCIRWGYEAPAFEGGLDFADPSQSGRKRVQAAPGLELPSSALRPAPGLDLPQGAERKFVERSPQYPQRATVHEKFDSEVDALLRVISPTAASDRMVGELARQVQQTIRPTFPGAEVVGFSTGDLACNTSLGMAMPEVDLVVSVNPDSLPGQLLGRLTRTGGASTAKLDARKVQKSAIRACTNRLVSDGGFKFRRSAFRGQEPKVTLLAPAPLGNSIADESGIPIDLSVNSATAQCTDAVLKACRRFDPIGQALLVFVRRWARDRGICHSAKGHLSPYAWSLLAAFYLQVSPASESPSVPPLHGVKLGSTGFTMQHAQSKSAAVEWASSGGVDYGASSVPQKKSVATIFREFVLFYLKDFNWRSEAISLRAGKRAAPELALPLHIVVSSAGVPTQVGPHIEDPFEPTTNLGMSMTEEGFARMQEELARALSILDRSSPEPSLAELFEPWVLPNVSNDPEGESDLFSSSQRSSELFCPSQRGSLVSMASRAS